MQNDDWLLGDESGIQTGEGLIQLMRQIEGQDITMYWLDDNQGQVFKAIIHKEGRYIGEAYPQPRYNRSKYERNEKDKEARELMSRYEATVRSFQKLRKKSIEAITVIDERPKTLNNKFRMPGMPFEPDPLENKHEAEVLEDVEEDEFDLIPVSRGFKRPLSERY